MASEAVPESGAMIRVEDLVFDYPGLRALDGVSFEVGEGSITALVGPNGAGKTTLLRCIASLEAPTAGRITVSGLDVRENPRECHRSMGYLSDFFGLYDQLTVEQCLRHRAAVQGMPPVEQAKLAARAAERTGIADRLKQKSGELSRGLRQRLAIAQSILHQPRLVMLDEPASGLDPEARMELSTLLVRLAGEGMTLIVSSHILAELEDYCTHMMILREGRLVEHRAVAGAGQGARRATIAIALADPDERLPGLLAGAAGCEVVSADARAARVLVPASAEARHGLLRQLMEAGLAVSDFHVARADLQEAYLARMREAGGS
jgi:ABC-2 type transport system ATP-binding protein